MILKNSTTVKEKIERLLKDEIIEVTINQETIMVGIEDNEENIWGLLVGTGYLKVIESHEDGKRCKVQILNYDVSKALKELWEQSQYTGDMNNPSEMR